MADQFLQSSDYIARKSLVYKTLAIPRTLTADLLPSQDGVLNLGSSVKAFNNLRTRSVTADNISSTGSNLLGPTTLKGADQTYCGLSAKNNTLDLSGGQSGGTSLISESRGTDAGYLRIYVGGNPYLIPLYNLPV